MKISEKIEMFFDFYNYLNFYQEQGIEFKFYSPSNKTQIVSFALSNDINIGFLDDAKNKIVDIETIKKFILKRYDDRKLLVSEATFFNEEINYLNSFPKEFISEFEYQIKPLIKELESIKVLGIGFLRLDLKNKVYKNKMPPKADIESLNAEIKFGFLILFNEKISLETRLLDLPKKLNTEKKLRKLIAERLSNSFNKQLTLDLIIEDYYDRLGITRDIDVEHYESAHDIYIRTEEDIYELEYFDPLLTSKYLVENGYNYKLSAFAKHLYRTFDYFPDKEAIIKELYYGLRDFIEHLAEGVVLSYLLPELEKDLQELKGLKNQIQIEPEIIEDAKNIGETAKQLKRGKETTHKQQIILLKELGFFELPLVANLSIQNRAKLIAKIINKDWTNGEQYERYYGIDKLKVPIDDYFVKAEINLKFVNNLFIELDVKKKVE